MHEIQQPMMPKVYKVVLSCMLFIDTWSQEGHLVSCATIFIACKLPEQTSGHKVKNVQSTW